MDAGADVCVVSVHKMGAGFEQGSVFHQQGDLVDPKHLSACADLLMTTSPNVMVYAALDGWRRQMVEQGHELLTAELELATHLRARLAEIPGIQVLEDELLGEEASRDLDITQILMDVSATGTSGYQASDWLRENCKLDLGMSDHRRVLATMSFADDKQTADRLITAVTRWRKAANDFERPPQIRLPSPAELQLDTVALPRDAFFGPAEMVPAAKAAGRVAAEQITPYPPGIPAVIPGERLNDAVIDYLRSGVDAGMTLPDPSDPTAQHFRVVA
jgi:arginine/lysine/ornithine decarboxylase